LAARWLLDRASLLDLPLSFRAPRDAALRAQLAGYPGMTADET
jgi:hypothetical protein